jgi:hypothetical protein
MPITTENTTVTRVNNDSNGNPRYVIHWLALLQCEAMQQWSDNDVGGLSYNLAQAIAKNAGFKKYHNKSYGGGLVVQSYNVQDSLDHLQSACERWVVDNTDNDCLTQHVLLCADQSYLDEGKYKTLHACIKAEKRVTRLPLAIVQDWLQGLPTACTVEYMNHAQEQVCIACGLIGWTSDMYWRYAAKTLLAYKG